MSKTDIIKKHYGYFKKTRYFSKRMQLPWYWGLNIYERINNLLREIFKK